MLPEQARKGAEMIHPQSFTRSGSSRRSSITGLALGTALAAMAAVGVPGPILADGTEELGPPLGIIITDGTDIVVGGTGLFGGIASATVNPGSISVTVSSGVTVDQVLLYWQGRNQRPGDLPSSPPATTQINISGAAVAGGTADVTGALIGGPSDFPPPDDDAAAYRADITGLVTLAAGGSTTINIAQAASGSPFDDFTNGAGILAIIDDGSGASVEIADGVDVAFQKELLTAVPKTFNFASSTLPRTAKLNLLFGDVTDPAVRRRPNSIQVKIDGVVVPAVFPDLAPAPNVLQNPLFFDGADWSTVVGTVTVPPGATSITIEPLSIDDGSGDSPESFTWVAAGVVVRPPPSIELVKQVSVTGADPFFDADNPGDPDVPTGSVTLGTDATYRLIVRNTGFETLTNLVVTDPTLGLFDEPVPGGDLLPGEERTIVSGDIGFASLVFVNRCDSIGNKENVATVDADGKDSGAPVSDTDPANVNCIEGPAIQLVKQVSLTGGAPFFDADNPGDPDVPTGTVGSTDATYRLIVANVGDEILIDAIVNDATLGMVNVPVPGGPLGIGEERVIDVGDFGFGNLFFPDRCNAAGNQQNIALVNAVGGSTGIPVSDDNPANVNCVESCLIEVSKTCLVAAPPPDNLVCQDSISATTLRYIGPDRGPVTVAFEGSDRGMSSFGPINLVSGLTILTDASGSTIDAGLGQKLGSRTEIFVDGLLDEVIHTSCSAIYAAGQPAPLDGNTPNPPNSGKGDPSPNWFVVNFRDKEDVFVEVPTPPTGAGVCEIFSADGALCTKRPTEISLRYNGGDCTQSMNTQDPGKISCSGDAGTVEPVRIVVSKPDGKNVSLDTGGANVAIGDVVTATAATAGRSELDSDSLARIFDGAGNLLQEVRFHTSCSQDLRVGDVFGGVEVAGFVNSEQGVVQTGADVVFDYKIANTGTTDVDLTSVFDNVLGELLDPSPQALDIGQMLTISATDFVDSDVTNVVTATGNVAGNPAALCQAVDTVTVNVVVPPKPPGSCELGKPVALEFEYTGEACDAALDNPQGGKSSCLGNPASAEPVRIVITKDADKVSAAPNSETIPVGGLFTVAKTNGDRLASETRFDIRQGGVTLQSLKIHTSCSKDLAEGDRFGGVVLRTFTPEP